MNSDTGPAQLQRPGPDLAAVLPLVAAAIPLPKATLAALRLTCKATMLAVDQGFSELKLSTEIAAGLRVGSSLMAGLTSLRFNGYLYRNKTQAFLNVFKIASNSSSTMISLDLDFWSREGLENDMALLFAELGACQWPVLRSLRTYGAPLIFHEYINIDSMPSLTKLRLRGLPSPLDVAALARGQHFGSSIRHLEIDIDATREFYDSLEELLQGTSQLTQLSLKQSEESVDIGFLAAAELPKLEVFELNRPKVDSLEPIFCINRPSLQKLNLQDGLIDKCYPSVEALLSQGSATLSALKHLELPHSSKSWRFLREMRLETLKSLKLHMYCRAVSDVAHLAEALTHLPRLEALRLGFTFRYHSENYPEREADVVRTLFSGVTLPRLRQLDIEENDEYDTSATLLELINVASQLPQLEELYLWNAEVGRAAFQALADAGRQGQWPRLKAFRSRVVPEFQGASVQEIHEETQICREIVLEVWPDMDIQGTLAAGPGLQL